MDLSLQARNAISDCHAGLTGLTSLNLHGCDLLTCQGVRMICALTNLRHLDLDLCSKASGLQHMAGMQGIQHPDKHHWSGSVGLPINLGVKATTERPTGTHLHTQEPF